MTDQDEHELHRLTELLELIDRKVGSDPKFQEALQKAALAFSLCFTRGFRRELEKDFELLEKPLTDSQRAHLIAWESMININFTPENRWS